MCSSDLQAIERAGSVKFNRGGEAARSAIEMATVMKAITSDKAEGDRPIGVKRVRRKRK